MQTVHGKSVFQGVAIGKILFYEKKEIQIRRERIPDSRAEVKRFQDACNATSSRLNFLSNTALSTDDKSGAMIIDSHKMILEDPTFTSAITNKISANHINAEYAVFTTSLEMQEALTSLGDEVNASRSEDIADVSSKIIEALCGATLHLPDLTEPIILVCDDLSPSDTMQLNHKNLLALVLKMGSYNSHTSILARTKEIPSLIGIDISASWNGHTAILDGFSGSLIIDPDEETLLHMEQVKKQHSKDLEILSEIIGKPTITKSGKKVNLYANIGSVADLEQVINNDAEGIGLFRSEFLYLEKDALPSEEAQYRIYKELALSMKDKRCVIRTMDLGADKHADYLKLEPEQNPALGFRAIRICLSRPELLYTQLRAILRASAYGNIAVLFPMIISVSEVTQIKAILRKAKESLRREDIPYRDIEFGIMIETPAAALISDLLAKEVDFFSIGTNDLIQYSLALDRQNESLDVFYDPHHEAILRMIEIVIQNGHREGCRVGICGELAADLDLTEKFISWGIDMLSVAPSFILSLRKHIREI